MSGGNCHNFEKTIQAKSAKHDRLGLCNYTKADRKLETIGGTKTGPELRASTSNPFSCLNYVTLWKQQQMTYD